jgi:hypothetical protein
MIKVQIAGIEQELSGLSESWIHEQIKLRQRDGLAVCVRVFVKTGNLDIVLSSGECPSFSGGGRRPTPEEARIFDRWNHLQLNEAPINSGRLIGFLQQIKDLC